MPHDVFITYSVQDKPYADAICNGLETNGIRCWVAPRDIVPGADWPRSVVEAIRETRVMLLVFSSHSNASRQVLREIERAVHRGIMVIPVRIEKAEPSESMEYFLGVPHWLDAITPPIEQHIQRIVSAVTSLLATGGATRALLGDAPVNPAAPGVTQQPAPPATAAATRTCPYCDEEVRVAAKVCRHCGRELPSVVAAGATAVAAGTATPSRDEPVAARRRFPPISRRQLVVAVSLAAAAVLLIVLLKVGSRRSSTVTAPTVTLGDSMRDDLVAVAADAESNPPASTVTSARPIASAAETEPPPPRTAFASVIATIAVPENSAHHVAVNSALNKIYVSGGASANQQVTIIDGARLSASSAGVGSGTSVDPTTNRYWSAGVYSSTAVVRDGRTNVVLETVPLRGCPISSAVDHVRRRVWVSTQCNDHIGVLHADTFEEITQIPAGGAAGGIIVNPATGIAYFELAGLTMQVHPTSYAISWSGMGPIMAVNSATNRIYTRGRGATLQVVDGSTGSLVATVALASAPTAAAVLSGSNLVVVAVESRVVVVDGATNRVVSTLTLGDDFAPHAIAADRTRGRAYVLGRTGGRVVLKVIAGLE